MGFFNRKVTARDFRPVRDELYNMQAKRVFSTNSGNNWLAQAYRSVSEKLANAENSGDNGLMELCAYLDEVRSGAPSVAETQHLWETFDQLYFPLRKKVLG